MKASVTPAELEVMNVLWQENRPMLYTEIRLILSEKTGWKSQTIQTLITRLRDKGAIRSIRESPAQYVAVLKQDEFKVAEGRNFLGRIFGGSAKQLVAALVENGEMTKEDIAELREYLDSESKK